MTTLIEHFDSLIHDAEGKPLPDHATVQTRVGFIATALATLVVVHTNAATAFAYTLPDPEEGQDAQ